MGLAGLSLFASLLAAPGTVLLADFKGTDPDATHKWRANNDPVMGGQSYSTVKVEGGVLNFTGACKLVPALQAPGFITAVNYDWHPWRDVSSCAGLQISSKSFNSYAGFRVSFGTAHASGGKRFAYGYKAHFVPPTKATGAVAIPFHNFSDFWDDATGKPIHTCTEDAKYCPDKKTLSNVKTMSIWAEGVEGDVHLEVSAISGYGCSA